MKASLLVPSLVAAFSFGAAPFTALAQEATPVTLKIGDPAPKLVTGEWIQGEPVAEFDRDHAYVVEFWATWCGPCRATIPHLDEMHEALKDKGIIFIGQDCWERDESKVKPFVAEMGEKMSYRVALDKDKFMAENWMKAAGRNGIPCAFVVGKDGKIAWIGHPASLKKEMLEEVIAGKFDIAKAAGEQEAIAAQQKARSAAMQKVTTAVRAKDWDAAIAAIDEMDKADPELKAMVPTARLNVASQKGDAALALKAAQQISEGLQKDNAGMLSYVATVLLKVADGNGEAAKTAVTFAEKAISVAKPAELERTGTQLHSTLARAKFISGDKDAAVAAQTKALELARTDAQKQSVQEDLESYKAGKLPEIKAPAPRVAVPAVKVEDKKPVPAEEKKAE